MLKNSTQLLTRTWMDCNNTIFFIVYDILRVLEDILRTQWYSFKENILKKEQM